MSLISETVPLLSDDPGSVGGRRSRRSRRFSRWLSLVSPALGHAASGGYRPTDLASDALAGVTMCVFHIPQGLAYGQLAGLRPVNGLYTSLVPPLLYWSIGRSRHLSIGTFALISLLISDMIGSALPAYADRLRQLNDSLDGNSSVDTNGMSADEFARLQVAIVGTFLAGLINLVLGVCQLGSLMRLVSDPMLRGFTTAAAVHIVTKQVPVVLGVKAPSSDSFFKLVSTYYQLALSLPSANVATIVTSSVCVLILYLAKEFLNPRVKRRLSVPLPLELLLILLALAASEAVGLPSRFGVSVVGEVPRGFPTPLVPDFGFSLQVLLPCLPVALVGAAMSLSIVKTYAVEFKYDVNYNGELVALGASSCLGSFFQCFFASGALARCAVVVAAGMKTQLATIISCLCLLVVVLFAGPLFEQVPRCSLSAVIAVSLVGLLKQVKDIARLWRRSQLELLEWLVTFVSVIVFDVSIGLGVGFAYSTLALLCRRALERRRRQRLERQRQTVDKKLSMRIPQRQ